MTQRSHRLLAVLGAVIVTDLLYLGLGNMSGGTYLLSSQHLTFPQFLQMRYPLTAGWNERVFQSLLIQVRFWSRDLPPGVALERYTPESVGTLNWQKLKKQGGPKKGLVSQAHVGSSVGHWIENLRSPYGPWTRNQFENGGPKWIWVSLGPKKAA